MSFWVFVFVLLALALVILLLPLLRAARVSPGDRRQQQNIQIAREKKQQLEAQLAQGEIDQASYDSAYLELQTALALDLNPDRQSDQKPRGKWMALVVMLAVPAASIPLYLMFGEYRVIQNPELVLAAPAQQTASAPQMSLEEMEAVIKDRLKNNPEDVEGWFMLGRTLMAKQQFDAAVTAFQRSNDLLADEPGILFALADALAMQKNGSLAGEPEALVQRGLQLAPRFPNGLWLAGMAAEQRQDYKAAHRYWTQLLPLIADNPTSTREIEGLLSTLEERDPELVTAAAAAVGGDRLNLLIDISPQLKTRAKPGDAVFVYAKAMQGPPIPLAVKRVTLADLPLALTLGDADAMMPAMKLSSYNLLVVGARLSTSGNPVAQAGDFYTEIESVDSHNPPAEISLTIDQIK